MDTLDAYLDELASHLDCDPLRRDEIRLEVHAHLREMVEQRRAEGLPTDQAEQAAITAFGTAERVARRLATANRGLLFGAAMVPPGRRVGAIVLTWAASAVMLVGFNALVRAEFLPHGAHAVPHAPWGYEYGWLFWLTPGTCGGLAALLLWAITRRPWDAIIVCVGIDALALAWGPTHQNLLPEAGCMLATAALVAALLDRAHRRQLPA